MDEGIVIEPVGGVPMRVFAQRPRSLMQLADLVRGRPAREFLVSGERRLTDHELLEQADAIAATLQARGLAPGDRVAILAANTVEWATAFWGTVAAGGVVAALNGWWKRDEIAYALDHATPRFLVVDAPRLDRIGAVDVAGLDGVFVIGDGAHAEGCEPFGALLQLAPTRRPPVTNEDDPVAIFYTSGTTGRPKGAIATHRSWIAALQSLQYIAAKTAASAPVRSPDVVLATLPLFHVSGCQSTLVASLVAGTRTVLLDAKFDALADGTDRT